MAIKIKINKKHQELSDACCEGNIARVKALIDEGLDPMSSTLEIIHKYHIISAQISAWEKPF